MTMDYNDRLLCRKEAARYLGLSPDTLAVWDCTKRYDLKPIKVGRSVRYRFSSLEEFLNSRQAGSPTLKTSYPNIKRQA